MQQFMDLRPELTQMNGDGLETWLGALQALVKINEWNADAQELFSFLFSGECEVPDHLREMSTHEVVGGTDTAPIDTSGEEGSAARGDTSPPATQSRPRLPRLVEIELGLTPPPDQGFFPEESNTQNEEVIRAVTADGLAISEPKEWLCPTDGWTVENDEPVVWELHYWAKTYDRTQLEYNATVVEALHKIARKSHEQIVGRVASENLSKLDRLQAKTLHGEPFGHRCARSIATLDSDTETDDEEEDDDNEDDRDADDTQDVGDGRRASITLDVA